MTAPGIPKPTPTELIVARLLSKIDGVNYDELPLRPPKRNRDAVCQGDFLEMAERFIRRMGGQEELFAFCGAVIANRWMRA